MTRVRTPTPEDALEILADCSAAEAVYNAGVLFQVALAFAREHLRVDALEVNEVIALAEFLDDHATRYYEAHPEDLEDAELVPTASPSPAAKPVGKTRYIQIPIPPREDCHDPDCALHHGSPTQDDIRRALKGYILRSRVQLEGITRKEFGEILNDPTTRFRLEPRHLYVIVNPAAANGSDPDPSSNLN